MIKNISGWWYLVNVGAFHMFPFPTKADAEEALQEISKIREEREAVIRPTPSVIIAKPCDLPTLGEPNDTLPRHDVLSVPC